MAEPGKPSKTQLKKQMLELQAIGEALIGLPEARLAEAPLPDRLRDAVESARAMKKHGALKRQKQYIGRLMREIDAVPIAAFLAAEHGASRQAAALFRHTERWRDRLLAEGEAALADLVREHPGLDSDTVSSLVNDAQAEASRGRPPRAARELFRYLRAQLR